MKKSKRISSEEALELFRSDDIFSIGRRAARLSGQLNGKKVFYTRNIHINPTNICINRCRFCAFSRSRGEEGAYELTVQDIIKKLKKAPPFDEVHIVGGLHPDWPLAHYTGLLSSIKKEFKGVGIKAFTAAEVDYMQQTSGLPFERVFQELKDSGLDVMPGGGAEIFAPSVRKKLCPEKLTGARWLQVMRAAHNAGIKTNATMLYGHLENYSHRINHLEKLRALQDETGGFQAFVALPYQPMTSIGGHHTSGTEDLKCIAVSRLFLDNIPHIKAYWIMLGEKLSQTALYFGADDLEGTVIEERIAHCAGASTESSIAENRLRTVIERAGKTPVRRDSFYREIKSKNRTAR